MRSTLVKAATLAACGAIVTAACSSDPAAPPAEPVASVTMSVTVDTIRIAGFTVLVATPLDASGNPLTGRPVAWVSGTPSVATVAADGTVTGVAPGDALITATIEGQNASATVSVFRGMTGSWDGAFDFTGAGDFCPIDLSLTEDAAGAITGTGNIRTGGACGGFTIAVTGTNNTGGVADSLEMAWDVGFATPLDFNGNYDGDADFSGLLQGGGCVDCVTTATRLSIAPASVGPVRVGGATGTSLKR